MSFIYLASPYSHSDPEIVQWRFRQTETFVAEAMLNRHVIFSPIVHCHEIARQFKLPTDHKFWERYDFGILAAASSLWILQLPGWEESKGIRGERELCDKLNMPWRYVTPNHFSKD